MLMASGKFSMICFLKAQFDVTLVILSLLSFMCIFPSTVQVWERKPAFLSRRTLQASVFRIFVRSLLIVTFENSSESLGFLLDLRIRRFISLSRRQTIICLGRGLPFGALFVIPTRWERIMSPSAKPGSIDFTMFVTMFVVFSPLMFH